LTVPANSTSSRAVVTEAYTLSCCSTGTTSSCKTNNRQRRAADCRVLQ
jgi:hypothetical protein